MYKIYNRRRVGSGFEIYYYYYEKELWFSCIMTRDGHDRIINIPTDTFYFPQPGEELESQTDSQ